jgi:hypothetical protein
MLLSQVIRRTAITGRTDAVGEWVLGRQGGRWAHQWIDAAMPQAAARTHGAPPPPPPPHSPPPATNPATSLAALDELRRTGVLSQDEFDRLRERAVPHR